MGYRRSGWRRPKTASRWSTMPRACGPPRSMRRSRAPAFRSPQNDNRRHRSQFFGTGPGPPVRATSTNIRTCKTHASPAMKELKRLNAGRPAWPERFTRRFAGDRSGAGEVVFASGAVGAWAPFSGFATAPGSRGPLAVGFAGFGSEAPVVAPVGAPCVAVAVPLDLGAAAVELPVAGLFTAGLPAAPG